MRIIINSKNISSIKTGIGHYTHHLSSNLKKIDNTHIHLFGYKKNSISGNKYFTKVISFIRDFIPYSYKLYVFFLQYKFNKSTQQDSFDFYHETNNLSFKSKLTTILTIHDLSVIKYPQMHHKKRVIDFNERFENSIYSAKKIIVDCNSIKNELVKIYNLNEDIIEVIYLASRFEKRFNNKSITLKNFHLRRGINYKQYFICVGTLEPRKNIINVIKSYMLLPIDIRNSYPLFIIGTVGWHFKISNDLYDDSVKFLGYIDDKELECFYHGATSLLCLSIYEGFGLPPLEAMSCGTATILSDNKCFKELYSKVSIIIKKNNPRYIKNMMLKLILDETFRKKYEVLGLNYSKKFSWAKTAKKTALVYESLMS